MHLQLSIVMDAGDEIVRIGHNEQDDEPTTSLYVSAGHSLHSSLNSSTEPEYP